MTRRKQNKQNKINTLEVLDLNQQDEVNDSSKKQKDNEDRQDKVDKKQDSKQNKKSTAVDDRFSDCRLLLVTILITVIGTLLVFSIYLMLNNKAQTLKEITNTEVYQTVKIDMNNTTNELTYLIPNAVIKDKKQNNIYIDNLDWLDDEVKNLNIENNVLLMNTDDKELIINNTKTKHNRMKRISKSVKEQTTDSSIMNVTNGYNNIEFTLINNKNNNTLQKESEQLKNDMKLATNYKGIQLNFDGFGKFNLAEIEGLNTDNIKCVYNEEDKVFRVINTESNKEYMYISAINNEFVGCKAEDIIATNDSRLYTHKNFDKLDDIGYKTFAIKTETNLYCLKLSAIHFNEIAEAFKEQLKLDLENIEVKKIQKVVSTEQPTSENEQATKEDEQTTFENTEVKKKKAVEENKQADKTKEKKSKNTNKTKEKK